MKLNDKDYKYFDLTVRRINEEKMNKYRAKHELLMSLGYLTSLYCEEYKKEFVEAQVMVDFLNKVHDEYVRILAVLEEVEGGK